MKRIIFLLLLFICYSSFSQSNTEKTSKFIIDAGLGLSKIRTGYCLYTDITGLTYVNFDKKFDYTPLYSIRGKVSDGKFKYRLFFNFAKTKEHVIHDTTYTHTSDFHFRGLYPRLGFERILWSKWVELKFGFDFLYFYELYDVSNFATGVRPYPNASLTEVTGISKHKTHAWGFSPFLMLGVPIKKLVFISLEAGKAFAYGTTNSEYACKYVNLENDNVFKMNETGQPTPFYRLTEFNDYVQISIDYRFIKNKNKK